MPSALGLMPSLCGLYYVPYCLLNSKQVAVVLTAKSRIAAGTGLPNNFGSRRIFFIIAIDPSLSRALRRAVAVRLSRYYQDAVFSLITSGNLVR